MELFYRELGGKGQPLIILHGLFGSSDNWLTQAKLLGEHFHVYIPDQRNHGRSPHSDHFNMNFLADDIHEFIVTYNIQDPVILGHSLGGKAAMKFALNHSELISKLIVADIAPRAYLVHHKTIIEGLNSIPLEKIQSRNEADDLLSRYVPELGVRQFLLKNLYRKSEGGFGWRMNLPVLERNIESVGEQTPTDGRFNKPTLFIRGGQSTYVQDSDVDMITAIFPNSILVTLDAGHWVQAEKPEEFVKEVIQFIHS